MGIDDSLNLILQSKKMVTYMFYRKLFDRHRQIQAHFDNVNVERQAVMLTTALQVVVTNYLMSYPATTAYLRYLGSSHSQAGIPRDQFEPFGRTLIETFEEFHGDQWDDNLAEQWRDALNDATALMFSGYDHHITV